MSAPITWHDVPVPKRTGSQAVQRAVLVLMTHLPYRVAHGLARIKPPAGKESLDSSALGLAALVGRVAVDGDHSPAAMREGSRSAAGAFRGPDRPVAADQTSIPVDGGAVALRRYRPENRSRGLLIFAHGGGWIMGDLETHDDACRQIAHRAGVDVISVDYRLAPEHTFPTPLEDVVAAFRWAAAHAVDLDVDPARIAIGGDSAGGNLSAAATVLLLDDEVRPAFTWLLYPSLDLAHRHPSRHRFAVGLILTDEETEWMEATYSGGHDRADPRMSPLLGTVDPRLPPTYVATAGYDPIRDDGDLYAERLAAGGRNSDP